MPPNPPPPPPPRKGFSASVVSSAVKQSSNGDLLASIQRGTKLKKALVTNDRSAPLVQKAISVAEGNSVEKATNLPFSTGFPRLKSVKEAGAGGGIREEIERKLFERANATKKVGVTERVERRQVEESFKDRETTSASPRSAQSPRLHRNEALQPSAREAVRTSLNESTLNKAQRQEERPQVRNASFPLPGRKAFIPPAPNSPPAARKGFNPPAPNSLPNAHNFDLSYVPNAPPHIQWPPKCTYPSGERQGLNKFINNPAEFLTEDPKAKAAESKAILSNALQAAIERQDFETCIELKTAIKSIETSTSTEQIDRIMQKLDRIL